jgi:hypothetical protein
MPIAEFEIATNEPLAEKWRQKDEDEHSGIENREPFPLLASGLLSVSFCLHLSAFVFSPRS